ncbi:MAG: type II toxin-antitoxin system Phd/YefM family antitoxin [Deltaproteobacteria bacterium]|nr:type II toxin-antitoxin system Phd/YefM family antitoxin [Deltaproteobacteria bacterium]
MQIHNISETKAQLSAMIERVVNHGEEIIIGKAGKPVAKLICYQPARENKRLGLFAKKIRIPADFNEWPEDIAEKLGMK